MSYNYVDLVLTTSERKINLLHQAPGFSGINQGDLIQPINCESIFTADSIIQTAKGSDELTFILDAMGYTSLDAVPKVAKRFRRMDMAWEREDES